MDYAGLLKLVSLPATLAASLVDALLGTSHSTRMAATRLDGLDAKDAKATDPKLLREHSAVSSYTAGQSGITYPGIRVFYRPRPQVEELPQDPAPLPLLVFIHGLGGSVAQFHPLLVSLVDTASCLAIDMPGCGLSDFAPTSWDAYSSAALADLLETVIEEHRAPKQGVVLIAHSMGSVLAARLANKAGPHHTELPGYVRGIIAICPVAQPFSKAKVLSLRKALWIPDTIFNLWRAWDRWGGPESASVRRFVGPDATLETRLLQDRFNSQSRSPVFRRMAWGSLPEYPGNSDEPVGGMFGAPVWDRELDIPIFLIGGDRDTITPPTEVSAIEELLRAAPVINSSAGNGDGPQIPAAQSHSSSSSQPVVSGGEGWPRATLGDAAAPVSMSGRARSHAPAPITPVTKNEFDEQAGRRRGSNNTEDPVTPGEQDDESRDDIPPLPSRPRRIIETRILTGAGHAMIYTPITVRILSGMVRTFLETRVTGRFSLSWQLKYLSREDKWDVKNVEKWLRVEPVSNPIGGIFRAMKTLREVDEVHTPQVFSDKWGNEIKDIIDISHANPTYDPKSFKDGIKYHKFATVSKIPPTEAEVAGFISLVDQIFADQASRRQQEGVQDGDKWVIGVHCHYGFNRTGYFIVSYLVERRGFGVQEAIDEFARGRPNGIRHAHFLDRLFLTYADRNKE